GATALLAQQHLPLAIGAVHDPSRGACMLRQLTVLTVDRYEETRPHEREYQLQFFRRAMSRHMNVFHVRRNHVRSAAGHVTHRPGDRLFVARYYTRREDDGVVLVQFYGPGSVDGVPGGRPL